MVSSVFNGISIPYLSICVDTVRYRPGIIKLLEQVRPTWNKGSVKFRVFEGGLTNRIVGVNCSDEDMILVRIYGRNTEKIINRDSEVRNLVTLHRYLGNPPVYARFHNGLCYGFAKGRPIQLHELNDLSMARRIARESARMHSIPLSAEDTKQPLLYSVFFSAWVDEIPETLDTEEKTARIRKLIGSREQLRRECEELSSHLDEFNSPVVFCHNDLKYKNIIYSEEKDSVTFIDLEYGGPNFRGFDIGDFFYGFAGINTSDYNLYPRKEFQLKYLRMYLEEAAILKGDDPKRTVDDMMVEKLYVEVNKFALAAHMIWRIWGLVQARYSLLDFDYLEYAELRLGEYYNKKDSFLSLKTTNNFTINKVLLSVVATIPRVEMTAESAN